MRAIRSAAGSVGAVDRRVVGMWRLVDPRLALSSAVSLTAGAALAWNQSGTLDLRLFLLAAVAVGAVEIAKTAIIDLYEFNTGEVRTILPERRVIADGLLSESEVSWIACASIVVAGVAGWSVALASRPMLLMVGVAAFLAGIEYAAAPLRLSHRALGEALVFFTYGPLIVLAAQIAFGGAPDRNSMVVATTLGLLVVVQILFAEAEDAANDEQSDRWTLPVLLGRESTCWLASAVVFFAFAIPLLRFATGGPLFVAALLAGAPFALVALLYLARQKEPAFARLLIATAQLFAVAAFVGAVSMNGR